jgi:hypothetical protein
MQLHSTVIYLCYKIFIIQNTAEIYSELSSSISLILFQINPNQKEIGADHY